MSRRRSSSDRLGPSPSGRTEIMETGFSSRVASPLRLSGGASGEVASRVSIAASVVVSRRTPPEAGPAGPYLRVNRASNPLDGVLQSGTQVLDGREDLARAGVQKLLLAEAAGEHADRADLGGRRGPAVPHRVADHHRVLGVGVAGLGQSGEDEVGLGLGLLDVARVGPVVDERAGVEQREVVLELLGLGRRGEDHGVARALEVLDQFARAREGLDLTDQLRVEDLLCRADLVALPAVEALAGEGG